MGSKQLLVRPEQRCNRGQPNLRRRKLEELDGIFRFTRSYSSYSCKSEGLQLNATSELGTVLTAEPKCCPLQDQGPPARTEPIQFLFGKIIRAEMTQHEL